MAPFTSTRDPFSGSQMHTKSIYPDTSRQHHRSSGSPLLVSSSVRAVSSPHLVHGNSPLLKAFNVTPDFREVDIFPSPGQFSDAEFEEGSTSPSSRALQDQLYSATKALEELKEAVRRRRTKRYSLSSRDLGSERIPCIGTEEECVSAIDSTGLGIIMGTGLDSLIPRDHQRKSVNSPQVNPSATPSPWRKSIDLPARRRHWHTDTATVKDCDKKDGISEKHIFSPHAVASPTMTSTAPPTPSIETGTFGTMATPIMPSNTFSASNATTTQQQQQYQGAQSGSSSAFASHRNSSNATAIAAVGAAGSLLILAALLIAIYFRKHRTRRHKSQMASVLDKVAPLPSSKDDTDGEKQEIEAIGSNDFFTSQKGTATHNNPEEYRTISPWLSLNMESHPFANASLKGEKFSHDLADSGLVGQQALSKDYSFNWNFPKLSVPPAAARAITTGHYVKKRATDVPQVILKQPERQVKTMSAPSFVSRRCSSGHEQADVMSQSASSECVDPEVDHRHKIFAVFDASSKSIGWIKSAFRHLTPTQQKHQLQHTEDLEGIDNSSFSLPWIPSISSRRSISQSSQDRSISLMKAKSTTSLAQFVPDSHALTQAVVQQVMEIRLPSLSIANSPMLDVVKETPRISSLKWSNDRIKPQRSLSSGSGESKSDIVALHINRSTSRRVSWAGPLESCREDSKESMLDYLRSSESSGKLNNINRSRVWTPNHDSTDTDDDTKEGYEAESEEMDTEAELDCNLLKSSTPVITLTCSEEEGRFERQISLNSVYREATFSDDHSKLESREEVMSTSTSNAIRDDSDDDKDEDGATIIVHSSESTDDYGDETDSCHSGALHSLLVDDFPTIPEWTPISSKISKHNPKD